MGTYGRSAYSRSVTREHADDRHATEGFLLERKPAEPENGRVRYRGGAARRRVSSERCIRFAGSVRRADRVAEGAGIRARLAAVLRAVQRIRRRTETGARAGTRPAQSATGPFATHGVRCTSQAGCGAGEARVVRIQRRASGL